MLGLTQFEQFLEKYFIAKYDTFASEVEELAEDFGPEETARAFAQSKTGEEAKRTLVRNELLELEWDPVLREELFGQDGFEFELHTCGKDALFCGVTLTEERMAEVEGICNKANMQVIWGKYDPSDYI